MRRKYILTSLIFLSILSLSGCAVINKPVEFVDKFIAETLFPEYSGPKANVVVADFGVKAAKATTEVGAGLRDMLVAGLGKTNRFSVIPLPKDAADKSANLIIAVDIVDFQPRASGGSLGVGGGGSAASGTLGSLLGTSVNKTSIALNIKIVDAQSSKILASGRTYGQVIDSESPNRKVAEDKEGLLNEGLASYANTSMEQAIQKCIFDSVNFIVEKVPQSYYKGDKSGKT
jgi:curli biogenesis system outer membrane secretion channel CsgG